MFDADDIGVRFRQGLSFLDLQFLFVGAPTDLICTEYWHSAAKESVERQDVGDGQDVEVCIALVLRAADAHVLLGVQHHEEDVCVDDEEGGLVEDEADGHVERRKDVRFHKLLEVIRMNRCNELAFGMD